MSKILGKTISKEVMELFNKELTTAILSTTSEDGHPHAMPVHLMVAPNENTIRLALMKIHKSTENIKNNSRAYLTVLEGTDIALGISGNAKVIKEPMVGNDAMSMIEFKVEEVKSDTTPTVIVTSGVKSNHRTEKTQKFFRIMFDELNLG